MLEWTVLGITIIILFLLAVWRPVWLVPLLGVAVALEISINWYPDLALIDRIMGDISLTKLTSFAIIIAAFLRLAVSYEMRHRAGEILKDSLTMVLIIFLLLGAASVLYSADPGNTIAAVLRLVVMFLVFVSITLLMEKDKILLTVKAVHITALVLAVLAFYEGLSGNLIWQGELLLREHILRVNTTFVDPNIYARFIILGIVANFVLQLFNRENGISFLYMAGLAVLLAELMLTSSRGGVITLAVILIAVLILLPNKKAVLWVIGLGLLCAAIVLFLRPDIWARLISITQNLAVSNTQRLYLWKAAIAIFRDNMLTGTGLGSFQTVFTHSSLYQDYLRDVLNGATLSHTTILTIAAELGILGLTVLAAFWVILLGKLYKFYANSSTRGDFQTMFNDSNNEYYMGSGFFLWILTIFISSQGEGRFFEDPMLWLSCALLLTIKFTRERRSWLDW